MSSTLAGIEVKTTGEPTTSFIPPTPRVVPIPVRQAPAQQEAARQEEAVRQIAEEQRPAEQPQNAPTLFWLIAPLSLLITGCATFLLVRRWLKRSGQDRDELA